MKKTIKMIPPFIAAAVCCKVIYIMITANCGNIWQQLAIEKIPDKVHTVMLFS
jgi:hypothetical protein